MTSCWESLGHRVYTIEVRSVVSEANYDASTHDEYDGQESSLETLSMVEICRKISFGDKIIVPFGFTT